jgi:hypothetical protein
VTANSVDLGISNSFGRRSEDQQGVVRPFDRGDSALVVGYGDGEPDVSDLMVGGGTMGPDEDAALEAREVQDEVELVDDEALDATDSASLPDPGGEPPGELVEEVLGVRALTGSEPSADELDVTYRSVELPEPDDGDRDKSEEREPNLDEALKRTVLPPRLVHRTLRPGRASDRLTGPVPARGPTQPSAIELLESRCPR